jgi:hypothetical protein
MRASSVLVVVCVVSTANYLRSHLGGVVVVSSSVDAGIELVGDIGVMGVRAER